MTKPHPKPSDRGRNSPEPGPTPGTRAEQRDTEEQLDSAHASGDDVLAWERDEQEKLPPRGLGSQHNQGDDKGPRLHESAPKAESPVDEEPSAIRSPAGSPAAEFHSGGTRGPSNDSRG